MSAKNGVVVGGEPRIDLLPPEIKQKKDARRRSRVLVLLVGAVVAACAVAYVGVSGIAVASQAQLSNEQDRTLVLIAEQGKYSEARDAAATVATASDARLVASATEILWREQFGAIQGTLPTGATITQIAVTSRSATGGGTVGQGIAAPILVSEVSVTAAFPTVDSVATWLDQLPGIPGYAVAWVTPITDADGIYEIQAAIGLTSDAFAERFATTETADDDADAASTENGE
jgi:hypothetical protein